VTTDSPFSVPPSLSGEPFSAFAPPSETTSSSPFARAPRMDEQMEPERKPVPAWKRFVAAGSSVVMLVACVLLGFSFWETRVSGWLAERSQQALRNEFALSSKVAPSGTVNKAPNPVQPVTPSPDTGSAQTTAPVPAEPITVPVLPKTGELVGRLTIPAIALDWMIVAGTDPTTLKKGPGAWMYGAFPGAPGNATLSGHRTTYGGPFRRLGDLVVGDEIFFEAPDGSKSVFQVRGMGVVSPKDVYVTESGKGVRLTLLTCDPPGTAARRLVIQAELVSGTFIDQALPASEWSFLDK
jgi:LPXTG-site transpeptidase (sortase) family protein